MKIPKFKFDPNALKPKRKPEKCPDCKAILSISKIKKGLGYCEACSKSFAVPIGKILNDGPHKGKLVYLKSALLAEEAQEWMVYRDAQDEVKDELKVRDYFIVELYEEGEF